MGTSDFLGGAIDHDMDYDLDSEIQFPAESNFNLDANLYLKLCRISKNLDELVLVQKKSGGQSQCNNLC